MTNSHEYHLPNPHDLSRGLRGARNMLAGHLTGDSESHPFLQGHPGPQDFPFSPRGGFPGFPGRGGPSWFDPKVFESFGPWARGAGHGHGRGRGGRAQRGNVRAAILTLLAERPMHGYEMIQEITARSNGFWRPSPGSVYPTLQLLADEGLVTIEEGSSSKRLYSLTEDGSAEAARLGETPPWEQAAAEVDPDVADLRSAMMQMGVAMFQVAQAADSEQKTRAIKVLTEAKAQLYRILAENPTSESDEG